MLCGFSHNFPSQTAQLLDRARGLSRQFREETITDLLMGGIIASHSVGQILVDFPNETATGADMKWVFANLGSGNCFTILIQAKKLYLLPDKSWRDSYYRELFYVPRKTGEAQAVTLYKSALKYNSSAYPMYLFYNHLTACQGARNSGVDSVSGVNAMNGVAAYILERLSHSVSPKVKLKRLGKLHKLFYKLPDILCLGKLRHVGPFSLFPGELASGPFYLRGKRMFVPEVPTPEEVVSQLSASIFQDNSYTNLSNIFPEFADQIALENLGKDYFTPAVGPIPDDIHSLIKGDAYNSRDARRSIVFVSNPTG